jgi:hypothetical protein
MVTVTETCSSFTLLNILLCFDWTTFWLVLQHNGMAPIKKEKSVATTRIRTPANQSPYRLSYCVLHAASSGLPACSLFVCSAHCQASCFVLLFPGETPRLWRIQWMSELLTGPFLRSLAAAAFSTTPSVGPHRSLLAPGLSQDRSTGFFTMCRPLCTVNEDTVRGTRYVPATAVFVTPFRLVNCWIVTDNRSQRHHTIWRGLCDCELAVSAPS